jgi:hypothetical protein
MPPPSASSTWTPHQANNAKVVHSGTDELALSTAAEEPEASDIGDIEDNRVLAAGPEKLNSTDESLEKRGAERPSSVHAEDEGGKYGMRAIIGGFGIR